MNKDKFLIFQDKSLLDALAQIEKNNHGVIFTINESEQVTGLLTDGDIRRYLLQENSSLEDPVSLCTNIEFLWESPSSSRELLMKKLDHRIRVLPILDKNKKVVFF